MEVWLAKNVVKVVAALILLVVIIAGLGYNSWRNSQNGKAVVNAGKAIGAASTGAGEGAVNTLEAKPSEGRRYRCEVAADHQQLQYVPGCQGGH